MLLLFKVMEAVGPTTDMTPVVAMTTGTDTTTDREVVTPEMLVYLACGLS